MLANQYREQNIGLGYTYHTGQHGFRFAVSRKGGTEEGRNVDLLELSFDPELQQESLTIFSNDWELESDQISLRIGYETAMDLNGHQWFAAADALYRYSNSVLNYASERTIEAATIETTTLQHQSTMTALAVGSELSIGLRVFPCKFLSITTETGLTLVYTRWNETNALDGVLYRPGWTFGDGEFQDFDYSNTANGAMIELIGRPLAKVAAAVHF